MSVTEIHTTGYTVRIRIKRLPASRQLEGLDLRPFQIGQVYDIGPRLAELLIVMEYAEPEMRRIDRDRAADKG